MYKSVGGLIHEWIVVIVFIYLTETNQTKSNEQVLNDDDDDNEIWNKIKRERENTTTKSFVNQWMLINRKDIFCTCILNGFRYFVFNYRNLFKKN